MERVKVIERRGGFGVEDDVKRAGLEVGESDGLKIGAGFAQCVVSGCVRFRIASGAVEFGLYDADP